MISVLVGMLLLFEGWAVRRGFQACPSWHFSSDSANPETQVVELISRLGRDLDGYR
jgi:hypothetical protein